MRVVGDNWHFAPCGLRFVKVILGVVTYIWAGVKVNLGCVLLAEGVFEEARTRPPPFAFRSPKK